MRDAAFTIYGLLRLGFTVEANRFMDWLNARFQDLNPDGSLQLVYGIDGRRDLPEEELRHLDGYSSSKPVRIGNAASHQQQLDMYGALMDAVYLYDTHGTSISFDLWMNLCRLLDYVCQHWQLPDEGIWEVRGGRRHFVYSKVMCWGRLGSRHPVSRSTRVSRESRPMDARTRSYLHGRDGTRVQQPDRRVCATL